MTTSELLVVGYRPPGGPHVPDVPDVPGRPSSARWPVVAEVPPHVVVLRAPPEDLPEVARHARLAMARRSDGGVDVVGDEAVLDQLDDAARLFVRAWREQPARKRDRLGEGLPWDHPGFEPPDRPGQ